MLCLGLLGTCAGECLGLWCEELDLRLDFIRLGLSLPLNDIVLLGVGEALNFRTILGDVGVAGVRGGDSVGFMLTVTGFVRGSCFGGTFSGGPMGLSSRFLFLRFSVLFFSSRLLLLLRFSFVFSSDLLCADDIGVIVMELGSSDDVDWDMGIISIPDRLSWFPPTENPEEGLEGIGVILTLGVTKFFSISGDFSCFRFGSLVMSSMSPKSSMLSNSVLDLSATPKISAGSKSRSV